VGTKYLTISLCSYCGLAGKISLSLSTTFKVILHTNKQTDRQTETQTDQHRLRHTRLHKSLTHTWRLVVSDPQGRH